MVGTPATAFVTIINAGSGLATGVGISLATPVPVILTFQTTDPLTNRVTGTPDTPVDLPAGRSQTFVIALTPTVPLPPTVVALRFAGTNAPSAPTIHGVNTLLLSASSSAVPDIMPLAVTPTQDGTLNLAISGAVAMAKATAQGSGPLSINSLGAFAIAVMNLGAVGDTITAEASTSGLSSPRSLAVQQTDPRSGAIIGGNVKFLAPGETATFGVFVGLTGSVPFDPAGTRVFVEFKDRTGVVRGSTSVALTTAQGDRILQGAELFFNERFGGNGRTCGTCHPADNNLTLDPGFIAMLPPDDPLFVAEVSPALAGLENSRLLRQFGLILENLDGFEVVPVMRGVPHTLAMARSVASSSGPRTGWSGDGAPGDGSLRAFATGAVTQHFTKTLNRVPGVDFRLPSEAELDAMEAFTLALGRQTDLTLPLALKGSKASVGQAIFLNNSLGKCNMCHVNAGATANLGGGNLGNANFNTGVEELPGQLARLTGEPMAPDGGFGRSPRPMPPGGFGDGGFNVPPLVEAADTGPFFHNNAVGTIEEAVAFYTGPEFNASPAAREIGGGISLSSTEIEAVAAFLRVINTLENVRSTLQLQESALQMSDSALVTRLLQLAAKEIDDAISVLEGGGLHPDAVALFREARGLTDQRRVPEAMAKMKDARALLIELF